MTKTFREFLDRKEREAVTHLHIVKKLLEQAGFTVDSFLVSDEDPYIFVHSNDDSLSFAGVRVYSIGETLAYRIQKESETHPYGKSYLLDVEGMYNDVISDLGDEEKTGKKVIKSVAEEFKRFFKKSREAEQHLKSVDVTDGNGVVVVRNNPTDYTGFANT